MAQTQVKGVQIKDEDITSNDIADAAVRGATANGGSQREIATGTVSDVDLRNSAVTPLKIDSTQNFTMNKLLLSDGTIGSPSLSFTNSTTTGLSLAGANILSFSTAGTEAIRVDASQNVGIGGAPANASSLLTLTSTTRAFLPPRMTTTQRDAIATPLAGMVIYNTTTNLLNIYTTSWGAIAAAETDPFSIHKNGDNSPTANIDWNQFEIQQIVIHKLASDPGSPVEGQLWYNTTTKQWKGKNDTSVVILG